MLPNKLLEKKLFRQGYKHIIAVDEVGVGPLAGPVVASAVLITPKFLLNRSKKLKNVRDSKIIQPNEREELADELKSNKDIKFSLSYVRPSIIDKINIYQATIRAMRSAINKLKISHKKSIVLVDGKAKILGLDVDQITIIKGDSKIFSIACASIIAKVTRDKMMMRYAKKYPQYEFEKHKGYGTKLHNLCLKKHGPCEIHRKSFEPVAKLVAHSK